MKRSLFYIAIITLFFTTSCQVKRFVYFNEEQTKQHTDSVVYQLKPSNYYLQSQDILYIRFHSTMSDADEYFRFQGQEGSSTSISSGGRGSSQGYLSEYVIDDDGYIKIPVIGDVYVRGFQVDDVQEMVEKEAKAYIGDVMVKVKLLSYRVTFIGEFSGRGEMVFYKDRVHLLDALAQMGELSYYTKWNQLRILRRSGDKLISFRVNLTDAALLEDEKFFLQPNDIVYAEPSWRKMFRVNVSDYTLIIGTVTSTIGFIALMISLTGKN